jgi:hypothetical protein
MPVSREMTVFALLGLVSAHFDIPQVAKTEGDVLGSITTPLNAGIAVVTPAEAIRQLLLREDVVKEREEHHRTDVPKAAFDIAQGPGQVSV